MDTATVINVVLALVSVIVGAVLGGGTVLVLYGRAVKSILDSPVIIRSLELAAASLPPEAIDAIRNTGRLLEDIATPDSTTVKTTTTTVQTTPAPLVPVGIDG
jgi:flagellar motor component MotA